MLNQVLSDMHAFHSISKPRFGPILAMHFELENNEKKIINRCPSLIARFEHFSLACSRMTVIGSTEYRSGENTTRLGQ